MTAGCLCILCKLVAYLVHCLVLYAVLGLGNYADVRGNDVSSKLLCHIKQALLGVDKLAIAGVIHITAEVAANSRYLYSNVVDDLLCLADGYLLHSSGVLDHLVAVSDEKSCSYLNSVSSDGACFLD